MRIQVLDRSSVCISFSDHFNILVGARHGLLDQYHLWLLTEIDQLDESAVDEIGFSGIRVACTYPVWLSLPPLFRSSAKLFTSLNEPWPLPYDWTLYPVSSGGASTSWLLVSGSSNILITGQHSSVKDQCLYRQIFKPSAVGPVGQIDVLVYLTASGGSVTSISELKLSLGEQLSPRETDSGPAAVALSDPVEALATVVQLTHAVATQPPELQGPVVVSTEWWDQLKTLPALFEWLHDDVQVYIHRCVGYVAGKNKDIQPLALADLVDTGRVVFTDSAPLNARAVIKKGNGNLFHSASVSELKQWYSPRSVVVSGDFDVTAPTADAATVGEIRLPADDELIVRIKTRFADSVFTDSTITVPSLGTVVTLASGSLAKLRFRHQDQAAKLLHLLS